MKRLTILMLLAGIFIGATSAYGQPPASRGKASFDPCRPPEKFPPQSRRPGPPKLT